MIFIELLVDLLNALINALNRLVNEIERWAGWTEDSAAEWQYEAEDVLEPDPFI